MSLQHGMDYIHVFPVIQWLVKKSIEFRAESDERIKVFAVRRFNHFDRIHHICSPHEKSQQLLSVNLFTSLSFQV